jgi:hypothetical protein
MTLGYFQQNSRPTKPMNGSELEKIEDIWKIGVSSNSVYGSPVYLVDLCK